jgi:hypothetical protein
MFECWALLDIFVCFSLESIVRRVVVSVAHGTEWREAMILYRLGFRCIVVHETRWGETISSWRETVIWYRLGLVVYLTDWRETVILLRYCRFRLICLVACLAHWWETVILLRYNRLGLI